MYIGILTGPFSKEPLEHVTAFAAEYGFGGMEVAVGGPGSHIDVTNFTQDDADRVKTLMERRALTISALAAYINNTDADLAKRAANNQIVKGAIDAASLLGVDTVCTLAGLPVPGKSKTQMIEEDCAEVFTPLAQYAESKGVKIAIENWFATNVQHLGHFERLFEVVPSKAFGLNYDPSHLIWQDIDYIYGVERFIDRIFHVHAKDTVMSAQKRAWVGNQYGGSWWRYAIPGQGSVKWGEFISALRINGYNGVLSIEHEDDSVSREEGFLMGKKYLEQFFIPGWY
ncbi:MAG: sugar phosphate isomerase/epimerase [Chthonomonadales bacterium]